MKTSKVPLALVPLRMVSALSSATSGWGRLCRVLVTQAQDCQAPTPRRFWGPVKGAPEREGGRVGMGVWPSLGPRE